MDLMKYSRRSVLVSESVPPVEDKGADKPTDKSGNSKPENDTSEAPPKYLIQSCPVPKVMPSCARLISAARKYQPETCGNFHPGKTRSSTKNVNVAQMINIVGNVIP